MGDGTVVRPVLRKCASRRPSFHVNVVDMTGATRPYRMTARAASAAQTATAILNASWELFEESAIADITLADIAARSGVTTQTVLRRFGDKEGVFAAMFDKLGTEVVERREQAEPNLIDDIVSKLVDNYEVSGPITLKMLAEEATTPAVRDILEAGRRYHRQWCVAVFSDALTGLSRSRRQRRLAQLVAICDVRTWEILRIGSRLSRRETKLALSEMLAPLVPAPSAI
jgi:AcrR family transcriptional regulator